MNKPFKTEYVLFVKPKEKDDRFWYGGRDIFGVHDTKEEILNEYPIEAYKKGGYVYRITRVDYTVADGEPVG